MEFQRLKYENGAIKEEGYLLNDKREGLWRFWYENGDKKQEGYYRKGQKDGLWQMWYQRQTDAPQSMKCTGVFENGGRKGEWTFFDENGVHFYTIHCGCIPRWLSY